MAMSKPPQPDAFHTGQKWEQAFSGAVEQVAQVRTALRPVLGICSKADEVVLLVSELSANAVAHSASGSPGGKFTVRLQHFPGLYIWGEVEDEGSGWDGGLWDSARDASGLFLVIKLASACGVDRETNGHRVVWFRIDYGTGDHTSLSRGTAIDAAAGPAPARRPQSGYGPGPAPVSRRHTVPGHAAHLNALPRRTTLGGPCHVQP
jgi:anti-sigma regulatory factor (Ser/Thr protein kinase)